MAEAPISVTSRMVGQPANRQAFLMNRLSLSTFPGRLLAAAIFCILPITIATLAPPAAQAQAAAVTSRPGTFSISPNATDVVVYAGESVSTDVRVSSTDGDITGLVMTANIYRPYATATISPRETGVYRVTITASDQAPDSIGEVYLDIPGVLLSAPRAIYYTVNRRPRFVVPTPSPIFNPKPRPTPSWR